MRTFLALSLLALGCDDYVPSELPVKSAGPLLVGAAESHLTLPIGVPLGGYTARAAIIDTDALARALKENWIAGAGIDVYEKEPPDPDFPLFALENATLAPHLAWYSEEANWSIREKIVEDFVRYIEGRPPRFLINKELA